MAKMYQRDGKLYVDYTVDGKRYRKSTKLDDTKENRTLIEKSIIPELERKIASGDIYKPKPKTFEHYFKYYEKSIDKIRTYHHKQSHRNRVLNHFKDRQIDSITRLEIKSFLLDINAKSRSKGVYTSTLIGVFEQAVDDGILSVNPAIDIKLPKEAKSDVEWFTKDEVSLILNNVEGILKPYLMIAFHTGMRPEEILGLQFGDFGETHISVKRTKSFNGGLSHHTKTEKSRRSVPYPSFILQYIDELKKDSVFLFPTISDSRRLYPMWYKLLKKCKLHNKKLYSTRHTFATTMLLDNHLSLNELAGILGHTTPKTTLSNYASIINAESIKLDSNFSPFGTFKAQSKNKKPCNIAI